MTPVHGKKTMHHLEWQNQKTICRSKSTIKKNRELHQRLLFKQGMLIIQNWGTIALPETNIAPENGWLEYSFPFGKPYFQGLLLLVLGTIISIVGGLTSREKRFTFSVRESASQLSTR